MKDPHIRSLNNRLVGYIDKVGLEHMFYITYLILFICRPYLFYVNINHIFLFSRSGCCNRPVMCGREARHESRDCIHRKHGV